ncbi:polysaccharide biosynthesis/export family protein [Desulfocicer vacuolatum]|nr:polysaccharide biosynthesis/export family protein [Desulfocicer vacuolatum]
MIKKIVCGMGVLIFITGYMAMASPAEKSDNAYIIGHGDVLRIFTWKEPDLSVEAATVRLDGKITFPLVNDVQAAGLSTMMLKKVLEDRLAGYVESPIVTVILVHPVSQRYYVLGEVQRIGEYPIEKNLTVMQAFAVAGGFTEWAAKDEIRLIRRVDGKDQIYRINYKGFLKGKNLEGNVRIQADDTIIVP